MQAATAPLVTAVHCAGMPPRLPCREGTRARYQAVPSRNRNFTRPPERGKFSAICDVSHCGTGVHGRRQVAHSKASVPAVFRKESN
eukprot:scaffold13603_cov112-Isochrysis_galbana.AAC.6